MTLFDYGRHLNGIIAIIFALRNDTGQYGDGHPHPLRHSSESWNPQSSPVRPGFQLSLE
jgi:hypothetical protein